MSDKDTILEKIKKLLRMKRGAKRDAYVRENWSETSGEKCAPDCDALTPSGTATLAIGN